MSAHTPGPWTENSCEIQAVDGSPICEMLARPEDTDKYGHHHADANSRLICAAPDLLAALERIVSVQGSRLALKGMARDAIARATKERDNA
jgi:hypothetical protein